MRQAPPVALVTRLLLVAVAVSVVHYADNTFNYAEYPSDGPIPDPPRAIVGGSWFVFTAFGVWGYLAYRRGELQRAALGLAVYSGSGLVGFAHYSVPGAFDMPWWRQAHIVADILCGIAIATVAVAAARSGGQAARAAR